MKWAPHDIPNKMAWAPSEDSDQPGHPPSLIRVFPVHLKKAWVLSYPLSAQRRLWSDWADAKADLSLCWAHSHFVGFVMRRLVVPFHENSEITDEFLIWSKGERRNFLVMVMRRSTKLERLPRTFCCNSLSFQAERSGKTLSAVFAIPSASFGHTKWTASSEFGTFRLCEQRRFRRACASAQTRQNLRCSLIRAVSQEEPSDRKPDPWTLWMAGHAQLKFVMTECSKTQIRLTGLKYSMVIKWFWF